jgi:hypothetical protein
VLDQVYNKQVYNNLRQPGRIFANSNATPFIINPIRPGTQQPQQPGTQQPIKDLSNMGPINVNPNLVNPVRPRGNIGGIRPGVIPAGTQQPVTGGLGPRPNNLGPMQGVGDPRSGAATIPGNKLQMQMRGPAQAAPTKPLTAMKKGGSVSRGVGKAIKGKKFKGVF